MLLRLLPLFGLALLALPLLELSASIWLAGQIGWWLAFWLFASALVGVGILKSWRIATTWAMVDSVRSGELPLGRMFWVARSLVAALLFIFPGPVSDLVGLVLLLPWPGGRTIRFGGAMSGSASFGADFDLNRPAGPRPAGPQGDGVIEGEYSRVDETARPLPREPRS